jgi:hypothetical protein
MHLISWTRHRGSEHLEIHQQMLRPKQNQQMILTDLQIQQRMLSPKGKQQKKTWKYNNNVEPPWKATENLEIV